MLSRIKLRILSELVHTKETSFQYHKMLQINQVQASMTLRINLADHSFPFKEGNQQEILTPILVLELMKLLIMQLEIGTLQ